MTSKPKDVDDVTFTDVLNEGLYGPAYVLPKSFEVMIHNFSIIGKTLLSFITAGFVVALLVTQPWGIGFINSFGNDPKSLHLGLVVLGLIFLLVSIAAPATQAIVLFLKRKLTRREAWVIHFLISAPCVAFMFFAVFRSNFGLFSLGLNLIWGASLTVIFAKWTMAGAGKFSPSFYWALARALVGTRGLVDGLVTQTVTNLGKKRHAAKMKSFKENKDAVLFDLLNRYLDVHQNPVVLMLAFVSMASPVLSYFFNMSAMFDSLAQGFVDNDHPVKAVSIGILFGIAIALGLAWLVVRLSKTLLLIRVRATKALLFERD